MTAKISVFVICVEVIICLLLYNLRDCNFRSLSFSRKKKNDLTCLKVSSYFYRKKYRWFPTNKDFLKKINFIFRKTTRNIGKKLIFQKKSFFFLRNMSDK